MVAMVAIDARTRIASSRRQAEARGWCIACLRAVSASTTRATSPARSRKRALHGGARQCQPHLTACDGWRSATRRSGAAGRCEAVVMGHPMWWRPSAKGAHELHGLHTCQGLPRPPTARWHEPAGTDERPARRPTVHGARTPPGGGPRVAHRHSDGTTSPRARSRRPRARAAGMFERGDKQCT